MIAVFPKGASFGVATALLLLFGPGTLAQQPTPATPRAQQRTQPGQRPPQLTDRLPGQTYRVLDLTLSAVANDAAARAAGPVSQARRQAHDNLLQQSAVVSNGRILIGVYARSRAQADALLPALQAEGFMLEARHDKLLEGWLPLANVPRLDRLPNVLQAVAMPPVQTNGGVVQSQADVALRADLARRDRLVNGGGVKVGIVSNSFNVRQGQAASVAAGDLPGPGNPNGFTKPVQIVQEALTPTPFGPRPDEGRAMAEIIHDIAPGAELAFYAPLSGLSVELARAYRALAQAGCTVIVDDVSAIIDPWYQDDLAVQVIDSLSSRGITMVTAAGNFGTGEAGAQFRFYERPFAPVRETVGGLDALYHDFDPSERFSPLIPIVLGGGNEQSIQLVLQWDQPWGSLCEGCAEAQSELFVLFFNTKNEFLGGDPIDRAGDALNSVGFGFPAGATDTLLIAIAQAPDAGPIPGHIKIAYAGSTGSRLGDAATDALFSNVPTVLSHTNAGSVLSVAASAWFNTPEGAALWNRTFAGQAVPGGVIQPLPVPQRPILSFGGSRSVFRAPTRSALGGNPIFFDNRGNRLPTPAIRQNPTITGADAVQTSFFGLSVDGIQFPFFLGTSAAAPAVAGAAALLLSASKGKLSPTDVRKYLTRTALDMDNPYKNGPPFRVADDPNDAAFARGYDFGSGFGLVQADKAIDEYVRETGIQALTIDPVCQAAADRRWVLRNPNGFGVVATLNVSGAGVRLDGQPNFTNSTLTFIAPPGEFSFFTANRQFATTNVRLRWDNPPGVSGFNLASYIQSAGSWTACAGSARLAAAEPDAATRVYPNPSPTGHFTVDFMAPSAADATVEVTDLSSRLIYREAKPLNAGTNTFDLDVPGVTKGVYLLKITAGEKTETRKIAF